MASKFCQPSGERSVQGKAREGDFLTQSRSEELELSYYGWIVVAMAFLANLVGFGLVYAYGIFLSR